jgi:hypothetical protein
MSASKIYTTESGEVVYGMMAEFASAGQVYHAAEKVRDAGYSNWDLYSPFPIHGIEKAMGVQPTKLPLIVAAMAFTGASLGLLMQWWMTAVDYPLVVQGKPYWAWEPFTPITFELGVLFSAFAALISMLAMNGLPRHYHPLLKKDRFLRTSDDRLVICIESSDPKFDPKKTRALLESAHGKHIDLVEE